MLKYRKLTDLTDEEIRTIVTDLFDPVEIGTIQRNSKYETIAVEITTAGWGEDADMEITEEVELTTEQFFADMATNDEDLFRYQQFLLAKGCDIRLKSNPYMRD